MFTTNIIDVSDQQRKWRREMLHTLTNKSLELYYIIDGADVCYYSKAASLASDLFLVGALSAGSLRVPWWAVVS